MPYARAAFSVALIALAGGMLTAQQEPVDRAMVARIRAEATERSRIIETFNYITNVTGGRLAGSRAHKEAAEYLRDRLAEWGMTNPHLESFPFPQGGWELEKFTLELTAPRYFPMYGFPAAWSTSTKGVLEGTPIYVADKTTAEIEALGEKLRGAIILISPPQTVFTTFESVDPTEPRPPASTPPAAPVRQAQPRAPLADINRLIRRSGAGAVLRPSNGKDNTAFVSGTTISADAIPQVTVVASHYNMVVRMMLAGAAARLRVDVRTKFEPSDKLSYNVIAEIPGDDSASRNEVVVIGAHLDSLHAATGAADNADAAAVAVEAMRILKLVAHPRRTIRLSLWGAEEVGLLGGKSYVEQHLKDQTSRDAISVYLNDDPGAGVTKGWYLANNEPAQRAFDSWLDQLKDLGLKSNTILANLTSEDRLFDEVGIPAITTIKDYTNYEERLHHTNTDFFEAVSEKDLQQSATVLAVFAYQAAMRNDKIPRRPSGVPAYPGR